MCTLKMIETCKQGFVIEARKLETLFRYADAHSVLVLHVPWNDKMIETCKQGFAIAARNFV